MAGSVNKVILVGNLGRDPEIRRLGSGDPVCNLRIATSESWKDKASGERKEKTEWHSVVIYNENLSRVAEQYLRKGSKVYIEGQLQTRKWTDQSGVEKYTTEVVLQRFRGRADDPRRARRWRRRVRVRGGRRRPDQPWRRFRWRRRRWPGWRFRRWPRPGRRASPGSVLLRRRRRRPGRLRPRRRHPVLGSLFSLSPSCGERGSASPPSRSCAGARRPGAGAR